MSYAISNGFILRSSNSVKVNKVNDKLREIFNTLVKKDMRKSVAKTLFNSVNISLNPHSAKHSPSTGFDIIRDDVYALNNEPALSLVKSVMKNDSTLYDIVINIYSLFTKHNLHGDLYNYQNSKIYFKTTGRNTIYFFSFESDIIEEFSKINKELGILEDFSFHSGSRDNSMKKSEYSFREKTWNNILKGYRSISESMASIVIETDFQRIKREEILDYLPDDLSRLISFYKKVRSAELFQEEIDRQNLKINELDVSEIISIQYDIADIWMKEIEEGKRMFNPEYKDKLLSQADLLKFAFETKFPMFK